GMFLTPVQECFYRITFRHHVQVEIFKIFTDLRAAAGQNLLRYRAVLLKSSCLYAVFMVECN
ncbi:MAG: hypothetical protein K2O18_15290, partial [Oscillospiraceae bacterium]|nr:hypothetical protein [Oscillospiraceae bacterium]